VTDRSAADVIRALDAAMAEMARLRAELVDQRADPVAELADDFVDTWTAAERFSIPIDTVRWLAREKGFGEKRGGRWLVSVGAVREHVARG
jgi:hypothetical protein